MEQVIPVTATVHGSPKRQWTRTLGAFLKYLLLIVVGALIAKFISSHLTLKIHGLIITAFAFFFTLQEAMFFAVRAKVGDPLQSKAVGLRELDEMLRRTVRLKGYLDRLWFAALPLKVLALAGGVLLCNDGLVGAWFAGTCFELNKNSAIAMISWIVLSIGAELTIRTFLTLTHVDRFMAHLQVEARKIEAAKQAVSSIEAANQADWKADSSLSRYDRSGEATNNVELG